MLSLERWGWLDLQRPRGEVGLVRLAENTLRPVIKLYDPPVSFGELECYDHGRDMEEEEITYRVWWRLLCLQQPGTVEGGCTWRTACYSPPL